MTAFISSGSIQLFVGAGVGLVARADERAVLDPGDVGGVGGAPERVRLLVLGQPDERAGVDELVGEAGPLLVGAVAPDDPVGLGELGDLGRPSRAAAGGWWELSVALAVIAERIPFRGRRGPVGVAAVTDRHGHGGVGGRGGRETTVTRHLPSARSWRTLRARSRPCPVRAVPGGVRLIATATSTLEHRGAPPQAVPKPCTRRERRCPVTPEASWSGFIVAVLVLAAVAHRRVLLLRRRGRRRRQEPRRPGEQQRRDAQLTGGRVRPRSPPRAARLRSLAAHDQCGRSRRRSERPRSAPR